MTSVYIESNGILYLKNIDDNKLEEDKYDKLWYLSKLKDHQKYDTKISNNITEKIINQKRLKLEYPETENENYCFSLW